MLSIRNIIVLISIILVYCIRKPATEIMFHSPHGKFSLVIDGNRVFLRDSWNVEIRFINSGRVVKDITIGVSTTDFTKDKVKVEWNEESFVCYCIFEQNDKSEKIIKLDIDDFFVNRTYK